MPTLVSLAEQCDVSYRQADHWCSRGYIPGLEATGSGISRTLSGRQADIFRLMALGVSLGLKPAFASRYAQEYFISDVNYPLTTTKMLGKLFKISIVLYKYDEYSDRTDD